MFHRLTRAGHSSIDPTLAVFDRPGSAIAPLLEDRNATGPFGRRDSTSVGLLPLAHQHAPITVAVYLDTCTKWFEWFYIILFISLHHFSLSVYLLWRLSSLGSSQITEIYPNWLWARGGVHQRVLQANSDRQAFTLTFTAMGNVENGCPNSGSLTG